MMTQEEMNRLVPEKLKQIEEEYGVKALYAAETGSRAWGLASADSDFDVRFIYIRPRNDYLRLNLPRDVIETPIDDTWDVSGWDLHKALRLLWKANPSLYEWISSQMRYLDTDFDRRIAPLMARYFNQKAMMNHYFHMAENNIRTFLRGDRVIPKKYFYALRPVLACFYIRQRDAAPPILYGDLAREHLPRELHAASDALLMMKKTLPEGETVPPVREINDFLDQSMAELETYLKGLPDGAPPSEEPLNQFFLAELDRMERA